MTNEQRKFRIILRDSEMMPVYFFYENGEEILKRYNLESLDQLKFPVTIVKNTFSDLEYFSEEVSEEL